MLGPDRRLVVDKADLAVCTRLLRQGSKSFALAQRLLPTHLKAPVTALYAFCREADDAIDEAEYAPQALARLHRRLDCIFQGAAEGSAVDRALSQTVRAYRLPRSIFDALLEGFAWDATGRSYDTLSDVVAYSARVASTVGILMTLMMGRREPWILGRAAELGVAMQLTNIARDVDTDSQIGRLYLPRAWLASDGVDVDLALLKENSMQPGKHASGVDVRTQRAVRAATTRLLACAEPLYRRADSAVGTLPFACRMAIDAAARIYRDIGRSLTRQTAEHYKVRAYVRLPRKLWLVLGSVGRQLWRSIVPVRPHTYRTLPELQFLIDAVHPQAIAPVSADKKRAAAC